MRAGHAHECSYDNGKALSKTQILQRRIAQLEDKLSQLQGKSGGSPSSTSTFGPEFPASASASGSREKTAGPRSSQDDIQDHVPPFPRSLTDPTNDFSKLQNQLPSFTPSLYPESLPSSDFGMGTVSPDMLNSSKQLSGFSKSSINSYDTSPAWPSNNTIDYQPGQLYSSPSPSTFNLDDPVPLADGPFGETGWPLRSQSDRQSITSNPDGRRYLYEFLCRHNTTHL